MGKLNIGETSYTNYRVKNCDEYASNQAKQIAEEYNLFGSRQNIKCSILAHPECSGFIEETVDYIVKVLTALNKKTYEINAALKTVLKRDICPRASYIEDILAICNMEGMNISEVLNTVEMFSGSFEVSTLYAEIKLTKLVNGELTPNRLLILNSRYTESDKERIKNRFMLTTPKMNTAKYLLKKKVNDGISKKKIKKDKLHFV